MKSFNELLKQKNSIEELVEFCKIPKLEKVKTSYSTSWHTLSYNYCKKNTLLPIEKSDLGVLVALSDPFNLDLEADLRLIFQKPLKTVYLEKKALTALIEKSFHPSFSTTESLLDNLPTFKEETFEDQDDLLDDDKDLAPIVRLLNSILHQAYTQKASDIHFAPVDQKLEVKFRLDGVLQHRHFLTPPHSLALLTRLKILGGLDIAEKRRPQDGRFELTVGAKKLDFRLSTLPTSHGERLVLRLLDSTQLKPKLQDLGLDENSLKTVLQFIQKKEGLIIVCGPTGSGKTTTLYSMLLEMSKEALNIMTIEDPIEYHLKGIAQMNVHPAIGLTFAKGLRHLLRQDPDVLMIGEIRDHESAQIAIQAALTGHLVLTTLHTNDAPSAITRLVEMGIEPHLISSALIGVMAQRLVRKLCRHCKVKSSPEKGHEPKGCTHCFEMGYYNRSALFELMPLDSTLKENLDLFKNHQKLREKAIENGLLTLKDQGLLAVENGLTSLNEIYRVLGT